MANHPHVHPSPYTVEGSTLIHYVMVQHADDNHVYVVTCPDHQPAPGHVKTLCELHLPVRDPSDDEVDCMPCIIAYMSDPIKEISEEIKEMQVA